MNPEQFILMMNDLPDAVIDSANSPVVKQKKKIWYMIPAVAACFIALISAALYPKLRIQTPDITAPSASTAESTVTTTVPDTTDRPETQAVTASAHSTVSSETVTVKTTAKTSENSAAVTETLSQTDDPAVTAEIPGIEPTTTENIIPETQTVTASVHSTVSSATVTVKTTAKTSEYSAAVTETLSQTDDLAVTAEIPATEPTTTENIIPETQTVTETTALTEQHIETTDNSVIPVIIEDPTIEIPLWKGIVEYPESVSEPHLYSRFSLSTGDMDAWMRTLYGIPQDYDLTQNQCLLIEIDTAYSDAVIIGCRQTPNGLTLIVAYLDDGTALNKTIHYAMPIPDDMTLEPDNCNADYLEMTNEELIQEMEKDKLKLKTENEQEGLQ